jgi:hypothetical protein
VVELKKEQNLKFETIEPMVKDSQAGLASVLEMIDAIKEEFTTAQTKMTEALEEMKKK